MRANAAGTGASVIGLSELARHAPAPVPASLPPPDSVALLQHSSGTTGMKKGVALSYASIALQLAAYRDALALDPACARIVSWLPLYHDMGLISSFLLPLWLGVPIVSIDPFDWVGRPELFFEGVERFGATHAWLPNFAFLHLARRISRKRTWNLRSLAALISCSEPCKPAAFDAFLDRFAAEGICPETLQTCYAMAETVFAVSQSDLTRPVRRLAIDPACINTFGPVRPPALSGDALALLSNGRPIGGCRVAIQRGETIVGSNEIGEICIAADYMFAGYHLNDSATRSALHAGWYRTGDIGFIDQEEIFVVGRIKDVVIINGKNVFAHDVEAAISQVAGVKPGRCVAFGRYSEKAGSEQLVVVAERDGTPEADPLVQRNINRAVVEEVGVTCGDIRIVAPGWLVKTTSGKTSRSENSLKYAAEFLSA
jgi:acyl-CoA synthetase (AMP-forming)/AMP-acid ligase II